MLCILCDLLYDFGKWHLYHNELSFFSCGIHVSLKSTFFSSYRSTSVIYLFITYVFPSPFFPAPRWQIGRGGEEGEMQGRKKARWESPSSLLQPLSSRVLSTPHGLGAIFLPHSTQSISRSFFFFLNTSSEFCGISRAECKGTYKQLMLVNRLDAFKGKKFHRSPRFT